MKKVFIDGSAGTTGLRIYERLSSRDDVEILTLPEEKRKDPIARKEMLNKADVAFLCLPDDAARESVVLVENPDTVVIDASTAHRTLPDWAYGFPELSKSHEEKLLNSKRIAVPGCHASGFIALVYPLVEKGLLDKDVLLTCHSITGYSGGGKKMIADYESEERSELLGAPRQYGITQQHKHLKEMKAITGVDNAPIFCPIVSDFYSGMTVTVPLFASQIKGSVDDIKKLYAEKYNGEIVQYKESADENGFVSGAALSRKDGMVVTVAGNEERVLLIACYDNLGKGASGAAIECMNMVIGAEKTKGLEL
ncbi:MAG: N-acetyl-gamma-glutamyl-phosphate reductase [Clostridia bacterium]|nr:N-acetyl-gamma-glutamyl-phosphate reductase [Clostridia bacterium]MBQ8446719.1 N-acetyl-gamma-glutamyl-phosphate reductase [Clostridia bacterium]